MSSFRACGKVALRTVSVLAVALLFGASLLAVAARLRETTPKQQCMSNLKQVVMAFKTYTDDYDQKYPYVGSGTYPSWTKSGKVWEASIYPYLKTDIPPCPKAGATASKPYTYFFNRRLSSQSEGGIHYPTNCVMFGDWVTYGTDPGPADDSTTWDIARSKQAYPAGSWLAGQRHGRTDSIGGAVYYFVDGRAKLLRRPDILPGNTVAPPPGIDVKPSFYP